MLWFWMVINKINFFRLGLFCSWKLSMNDPSLSLSQLMNLLLYCLSLAPLRRGMLKMGTWPSARVKPSHLQTLLEVAQRVQSYFTLYTHNIFMNDISQHGLACLLQLAKHYWHPLNIIISISKLTLFLWNCLWGKMLCSLHHRCFIIKLDIMECDVDSITRLLKVNIHRLTLLSLAWKSVQFRDPNS